MSDPHGVPHGLETITAACLKAHCGDSRLGDLSERYVRTRERAQAWLGPSPLATKASHLAASVRYVVSAVDVVLFARAVEPALRWAETAGKASLVVDLKERAMATLHATARRLALPALLLVAGAFLFNGAINAWSTWRETERLIVELQRQKAEGAAKEIAQYLAVVQDRIEWAHAARGGTVAADQLRHDYLRLLRQMPGVSEIAYATADGKELLRVSRLARDTVDSGLDYSGDPRFVEALKRGVHLGTVYHSTQAEPYVSLALARKGAASGVALAEVSVKRLWDIVDGIEVGKTGYVYVVDDKGRLIAGRDKAMVLRHEDLSSLPQVAAAFARLRPTGHGEGATFANGPSGGAVLSVHAPVAGAGWTVFVEMPVGEARAPLWNALVRGICLLALGIVAIALASRASARRGFRTHAA